MHTRLCTEVHRRNESPHPTAMRGAPVGPSRSTLLFSSSTTLSCPSSSVMRARASPGGPAAGPPGPPEERGRPAAAAAAGPLASGVKGVAGPRLHTDLQRSDITYRKHGSILPSLGAHGLNATAARPTRKA